MINSYNFMDKFRLLLPVLMILLAESFLSAQDKITVTGVVKSAETGEPLFGAYVLNGTGGVRLPMKMETIEFL